MKRVFLIAVCVCALSGCLNSPRCVDMCVACTHSSEQLRMMQARGVRGDAECAHELSCHFKLEGRIDRPRALLWGYIAAVNGSIHAAASLETYRQHLSYGVSEFLKELSSIKFDAAERESGAEGYAKYLISVMAGDETSEKGLSDTLARAGVVLPRDGYLQKLRDKSARSILPFRCICVTMSAPADALDVPAAEYWIRVPEPCRAERDATNAVNCTGFCCGVGVKRWQEVLRGEQCLNDEAEATAIVLAAYPDGGECSNYDICVKHVERLLVEANRRFGFPICVSRYIDRGGKAHAMFGDGQDGVRILARLISSDCALKKSRQ